MISAHFGLRNHYGIDFTAFITTKLYKWLLEIEPNRFKNPKPDPLLREQAVIGKMEHLRLIAHLRLQDRLLMWPYVEQYRCFHFISIVIVIILRSLVVRCKWSLGSAEVYAYQIYPPGGGSANKCIPHLGSLVGQYGSLGYMKLWTEL